MSTNVQLRRPANAPGMSTASRTFVAHVNAKHQECRDAYAAGRERELLNDATNPWRGLTVSHRSGWHQSLQSECPICIHELKGPS